MRRSLTQLGSRAIDGRTSLGRQLSQWRTELIDDLGGSDAVTTQQAAIVDLAVRTKLLVDSVDAYVLGMPSAVNKRRRCLYPVVKERQALVSQLQSLLRDLGLERRAKALPDLNAYINSRKEASPGSTDYGEHREKIRSENTVDFKGVPRVPHVPPGIQEGPGG